MTYEQKGITCRQCFIDNTYICQTKSKHHFFIFIYTGNVQTFTAQYSANYKIECWGASSSAGGAYVDGSEYIVVDGATQTSGYAFGIGQTATEKDLAGYARSGGGGYYGGYGKWCSGSGGSSFVSGHPGCNAISASSTNTNIIHTGQPNHYSGYKFTETEMKGGNESVKEPDGTFNQGHLGSGVIKITWHPAL